MRTLECGGSTPLSRQFDDYFVPLSRLSLYVTPFESHFPAHALWVAAFSRDIQQLAANRLQPLRHRRHRSRYAASLAFARAPR
jgi:hypothetical protein